MKNIGLILIFLLLALGCGKLTGGESSGTKFLTVDELNTLNTQKPDELKTKYAGKNVVVVGKVAAYFSDDPGWYESTGYQALMLKGDGDGISMDCEVKLANADKFKGLKVGDVLTVTGTLEAKGGALDLHDCSKYTEKK